MPDEPNTQPDDQSGTEPASTEPTPPAYANVLGVLPESLVSIVQPELEKFSESQKSQYKELEDKFAPWKDITEQYDHETANKAINFASNFEDNPVEVFNALKDYLVEQNLIQSDAPVQSQSGTVPAQTPPSDYQSDEDEDDPVLSQLRAFDDKFNKQQEVINKLVEVFTAQQNASQQKEDQKALEDYLTGLENKYGELDRDFMVAKLHRGVDGEVAAREWRSKIDAQVQSAMKSGDDAPTVIGGGGNLPSSKIDAKTLDGDARKALVVKILEEANKQGQ